MVFLRDAVRQDASAGLRILQTAGVDTEMLTGDKSCTAETNGADLGVEVRRTGPRGKAEHGD